MESPQTVRMPAVFLGHGSPMNAIESNRYTEAWRAFGASVPRPRAILVVSAHWLIDGTAVTAAAHPRTIHDFYGFPQPLFDVRYPAPGDPALAEEVAELVRPTRARLDHDWGLDHGAWSVLVHAFPDAAVPVLQLSLDRKLGFAQHVELARKLAPLRDRGVLILGSGNVVHNLHAIDWSQTEVGFDWAHRFDDAARAIVTQRPGEVVALANHPDYPQAAPTSEHFLPLLYLCGLALEDGALPQVLVDGYAYGSLSMTAYGLGAAMVSL